MKMFFRVFLCMDLLVFFVIFAEAKEWRGISPLKSNRSDVIRILGKASQTDSFRAMYDFKEGKIVIYFSNQQIPLNCVKRLPDDTVLFIRFEPKKNLLLSDLKFDLYKFKKFDPSKPDRVYDGYLNINDGLVIRANKNEVNEIVYFPKSKDQKQCPDLYPNPEEYVRIIIN